MSDLSNWEVITPSNQSNFSTLSPVELHQSAEYNLSMFVTLAKLIALLPDIVEQAYFLPSLSSWQSLTLALFVHTQVDLLLLIRQK